MMMENSKSVPLKCFNLCFEGYFLWNWNHTSVGMCSYETWDFLIRVSFIYMINISWLLSY